MRNYMRINRLLLVGIFVATLLSWWAQGSLMTAQMEDASASPVQISNEMKVPVVTVQESKDKVVPIHTLLDVAPVQENKYYKVAPVTVQDKLSLSDGREMHCLPCPPCLIWQIPRRMGRHASDKKHPQHDEKDHPRASAPAPALALAPPPAPASQANSSTDHPTQSKSWDKEVAIKALKICGNVLSTSPLPLPLLFRFNYKVLFKDVIREYSCFKLCMVINLLYSILHVSYKDKEQIVGVDAIVVNGISWGVLAFMFMFIVMHEGLTTRGKRCIVGLVIHSLLTILLIQFPILRWVKSDSLGEEMVGGIAALLQVASEIIPLFLLWQTWGQVYPLLGHRNGPAIRNYKKMTIVARAIDGFITLYWMQFCISTYSFDAFGIANVISVALSVISFVAHSAWALKPGQ